MAKTKKMKKQDSSKVRAMVAAFVVAAACVIGLVCWHMWQRSQKMQAETAIYLRDGISIETVTPYTGPFWEDGTDRAVEDVWQLTVLNTSEKDIQYLKLTAWSQEGTALGEFEVTTLTSGSTVRVLEAAATQLPDGYETCTYTIDNLAYLQQERSLHTEIFTLSVADQWIKLENHSQEDITNDIYVYYKVVEDDVLMGGITYRAKLAGGLEAGEVQQVQTQHFDPDTCEIMYLTYQ